MKNEILFLFFLPIFWLSACTKNGDPPPGPPDPCPWPEITTEGINTFGCRINSKEWVPCVDLYAAVVGLRPTECTVRESDGSNFLAIDTDYSMSEITDTISSLTLGLKPINEGKIDFTNLEFSAIEFTEFFDAGTHSRNWSVIIMDPKPLLDITRLDTSRNIISGTFEFILLDASRHDTLRFTDGRFDLKYYPQ